MSKDAMLIERRKAVLAKMGVFVYEVDEGGGFHGQLLDSDKLDEQVAQIVQMPKGGMIAAIRHWRWVTGMHIGHAKRAVEGIVADRSLKQAHEREEPFSILG